MTADLDLTAAARLVVSLDAALHEGPRLGSTAGRKAQGRLSGALSVWEALTGLPRGDALEHARRVAEDGNDGRTP